MAVGFVAGASVAVTPTLALLEVAVGLRTKVDLSNYSQARVCTYVTLLDAATALAVQYSLDGGATWAYLDGASGPSVSVASGGVQTGSWVNLAAGAKADVTLRLVTTGGNGIAALTLGNTSVQFK